jgi:hypothetical protein
MPTLRAKLLTQWRRIPRWAKVGYGIGWLLSSLIFSAVYFAAWAPIWRLDLVVLMPLLLGAVWPFSLLYLAFFMLHG